MRKLLLDLDGLAVDTFEAGTPVRSRATVRGHAAPDTNPLVCPPTQNWDCTGGVGCTQHAECVTGGYDSCQICT